MKKTILLILGIALISLLAFGGNAGMTTHITTLQQLQDMNLDLTEDYILDNDIDASATVGWNAGAGFIPVGTAANKFTGSFDGQGYTITGLFINRPATDYVGLFGYTNGHSGMQDVELENCNITGQNYVGSLVGRNDGAVSGCSASGDVKGESYVGGLIGDNNSGLVSNSSAAVDVTTADVTGHINYVGGLIGRNRTSANHISSCFATGNVSTGNATNNVDFIGGLIGGNSAGNEISSCYATGNVITGNAGAENGFRGGLIGINSANSHVSDSHATGNVSSGTWGTYNDYVGGLIGSNFDSNVTSCYATGSVTGGIRVGGLAGVNNGNNNARQMTDSYATGLVSGEDELGGLIGRNDDEGNILRCRATGNVTGTQDYIGGLIGRNADRSHVSYSHALGDVGGRDYAGGLIGQNHDSLIINCCAAGNADGRDYVGGLIGYNSAAAAGRSNVTLSHSRGDVTGQNYVGGLIGYNYKNLTVSECFSRSSVDGADWVGGLMGVESLGNLTRCYSSGAVTGTGANVGGLIGVQWWGVVTISACFWDTQTSNQATSAGGVGKTTEQMQAKSTFESAGWDFANIWEICEPPTYLPSYPRLQGDGRCGLSPCSPAPPTEEALIISFTG